MFDIGFFELVLIFIIGLVVLGFECLFKVVCMVGYWVGWVCFIFNYLCNELECEVLNQDM